MNNPNTPPAHTPGPWEAHGDSIESPDGLLAQLYSRIDTSDSEILPDACRANARLIAAAPDLLGACQEALANLRADEEPLVRQILADAIAKAEGR